MTSGSTARCEALRRCDRAGRYADGAAYTGVSSAGRCGPGLVVGFVAALAVLGAPAAAPGQTEQSQAPAPAGPSGVPPSAAGFEIAAIGGARTAMAVESTVAPVLDGAVLDDPAWANAPPATGFVQTQPEEGRPASERTEVRIVYTADTIYFGVVCYDSDPASIIVTDSRRDSSLADSDSFQLILDTFLDRQNGFIFGTSPSGQEYDGQLVNEGAGGSGMGRFGAGGQIGGAGGGFNQNWDGVWQVRTAITDMGWTAEFAIPFRTLRFPAGREQTWGVNFQRNIRRRNEEAYWAPLPRQYDLFRVSLAGQLGGVRAPEGLWRTLQMTPYLIGETVNRVDRPDGRTLALGDFGGDLKYGVTSGLALDLTYNTDFAQVEVDDQQINLDRFQLFFPEKRPFFLENAGAFTVTNSGGAAFNDPGQTDLFFSRRIGIGNAGQAIPILGGARLSGRVSEEVTVGFLNMQTEAVGDATPANNFTVARLRHDLPNRSSIGGLLVNRQATGPLAGSDNYNRTYAFDGRWGFGQNGMVSGFAARTETPYHGGRHFDQDHAFDLAVDYNTEAWRLRGSVGEMGRDFNPEVGFVRRTGFRKMDAGIFNTSRPPSNWLRIQELQPHVTFNRFWDIETGFIQTSLLHMDNGWEFEDSSRAITAWNVRKEGVTRPFTISGVPVAPGSYDWHEINLNYNSDRSAPMGYGVRFQQSGFFGGTLQVVGPTFNFRRGEALNVELRWSRNDIDLPAGHVVTNLASSRVAYNFSPRVFAQSLVQYNDSANLWSVNLRFGWLQEGNTGLFFVFNQSDGLGDFILPGSGRSVILKYTHLFDLLR